MFRSIRQMDAAVDKARVKAKRSEVKTTAATLSSSSSRSSLKKGRDPGVPNLTKVKAALTRRAEREQVKEDRRNRHTRDPHAPTPSSLPPVPSPNLPPSPPSSSSSFFTSAEPSDSSLTRRHYLKELHSVIADSDIILEVLDARDPLGCRNPAVERAVVSSLQSDGTHGKRLVLVLNKIDLVSAGNLQEWVKYLKHFYPVIAFKASTQQQSGHLNRHEPSAQSMTASPLPSPSSSSTSSSSPSLSEVARSGCVGASSLIQLLKNYSRNLKMKKNITVGVIGVPNVGKSSLINSLKRSRAVAVGNKPGVTKCLQQVKLDGQVTLIDSPGVISVDDRGGDDRLLLRNVLSVDKLSDPIASAQVLIRHIPLAHLTSVYGVAATTSPLQLLAAVAKKQGKLLQGGIPNVEAAARVMLQDLNTGKVRYETEVPREGGGEGAGVGVGLVGEAEVVREWAKEFDIEELLRGKGEVRVEGKEDALEENEGDEEMNDAVEDTAEPADDANAMG